MASVPPANEDPLVEALPPNTDYMTYLTLLEYQLTPQNLSTLNRLLSDDDGTLAAEIGWDLLKLVLPMLEVVPEAAQQCLDVVARRGNPREVVVRVAEELEKLANEDSLLEGGEQGTPDDDDDDDELATFAGEAPRVHLGAIKLDGMSSPPENSHRKFPSGPVIFGSLLRMLGVLHPRIKTQHPSRFLATSLPAALKGYRRMTPSTETTESFLTLLTKLSTSKRPPLPPRTSTAGSAAGLESTREQIPVQSAPLPDPESRREDRSMIRNPPASDMAISSRLLQAVMLEVLDEYMGFSLSENFNNMQWTARIRNIFRPDSLSPRQRAGLESWSAEPELISRDRMAAQFLASAKELKIRPDTVLQEIADSKSGRNPDKEDEEQEFPTSPSQIAFSESGALLLSGCQKFNDAQSSKGDTVQSSRENKKYWESLLSAYSSQPLHTVSPATTDALLALVFTGDISKLSTETYMSVCAVLVDMLVTVSDEDLRSNAYQVVADLLGRQRDVKLRIEVIKRALKGEPASVTDPSVTALHELHAGSLKSVAVNWLKNQLLDSQNPPPGTSQTSPTTNPTSTNSGATSEESVSSVFSTIFSDEEILALVFPSIPTAPSLRSTNSGSIDSSSTSSSSLVEDFTSYLPFYTAVVNFLYVLARPNFRASLAEQQHNLLSTIVGEEGRGVKFLSAMQTWTAFLLPQATHPDRDEESHISLDPMDVLALEDACSRARECFGSLPS